MWKFLEKLREYTADCKSTQNPVYTPAPPPRSEKKCKTVNALVAYLGDQIIEVYWSWHSTDEELVDEVEERIGWYRNDPYWKDKFGDLVFKLRKIKIANEDIEITRSEPLA